MRMHEIVMEIHRFLSTSLFKRSFVYASLFFVAAASKKQTQKHFEWRRKKIATRERKWDVNK